MAGPPSLIGAGRPGAVRVTAQGPFAVGFVAWRDGLGKLVCTVVAKATYALVPGESAPLDAPLPIQEEDGHWDDDPSKSVHVPSDLAPFKSAAEVVVVGSAFAPPDRPAKCVTARVVIGSVDKSLEVWAPRRFRSDGAVHESPAQLRFPLRYEHAAGGPNTDNPAGIDVGRADHRGWLPIPQVLPLGCELGAPGDHIPTAGLGPVASTWPQRAGRLGAHERAWLRRPAASPLPQAFPPRFFQAAPMDQWLDRALVPNERIVLESLNAAHPWLVTSLSGLEPRAVVAGAGGEPIPMAGDLLVIDTDRGLATLTFRVSIPVADDASSLRVVVMGVPMGTDLPRDAVRRAVDGSPPSEPPPTYETAPGAEPVDSVESTSSAPPAWLTQKPALPFSKRPHGPPPPPPRPSSPDAALPFRAEDRRSKPPPLPAAAHAVPRAASTPPPPSPPASPGIQTWPIVPPPVPSQVGPGPTQVGPSPNHVAPPPPPPPPPLVKPASVAPPPPPLVPLPPPVPVQPPPPVPSLAAVPAPAAEPPPKPPRASSFDAAFGAPKAPPKPPRDAGGAAASFDAAFGGAKAASDAAAEQERTREPILAEAARDARPSDQPLRRLAVVDLLAFDADLAPRLRAAKRFAGIWAHAPRPRALHGVDDPRAASSPDRDRADVLRVLSCGRPAEAGEIRRALAESLDDDLLDLEPPVLLVAGELRPTFDELETLRASVSVAQPVAGGDKKLLAAIAIAQEALAAPLGPRPDAALGLSRQIEQASASLSLPARYVASEVERLLLDGRKYRRRTLLGAGRVRADLTLPSGGEPLIVYLPETVVTSLPMLLSYPVVALCEVRPREDLLETQAEALFASALGRVLHARGSAQAPAAASPP
jgi:hypothetical protein